MGASTRQFSWRQGDVLTADAARALCRLHPEEPDKTLVVMVSHDCDLAATSEKEPTREIIAGRQIASLEQNPTVSPLVAFTSSTRRARDLLQWS